MRPIKLIISAFGPYAGKEVIDFGDLKDRSFFLIHGPTGAGKTSILDAICYALYGDTSGKERDGVDMRSHHAMPTIPTEVMFDFSIGQEIYRIKRAPEQERPHKRGGGTTVEPASATLWKRTGIVDNNDEGRVVESKSSRVTAAVEQLLGFKSDQFRQVVMLPQGQFRRLLMSDSTERQKILDALFKTEYYQQIEIALKESGREIVDKVRTGQQRRELILSQAGVAASDELEERLSKVTVELSDLEETIRKLRAGEEHAQNALNDGRQVLALLKEFEEAKFALNHLLEREEQYAGNKKTLDWARKASALLPLESILIQRQQELSPATQKINDSKTALEAAYLAQKMTSDNLLKEQSRKGECDAFKNEFKELEASFQKVAAFKEASRIANQAEYRVNTTSQDLATFTMELEIISKHMDETKLAQLLSEKAAELLPAHEAELRETEQCLKSRIKFDTAHQELQATIQSANQAQQELQKIEKSLARQRSQLVQLESTWLTGQAATLAQQLVAGSACPVCGSDAHPAPASIQGELPTEAQLNEKRAGVQNLEATWEQMLSTATEIRGKVGQIEAVIQSLTESGCMESDITQLEQRLSAAILKLKQTQETSKGFHQLNNELLRLKTEEETAKDKLRTAEKVFHEATSAFQQAFAVAQERESGIPEHLKNESVLAKRKATLEQTINDLERALIIVQQSTNLANEQLAVAKQDLVNAEDNELQARTKLEAAQTDFVNKMRESGFVVVEAYQDARNDLSRIPQLEQAVQDFEQCLHAGKDRLDRAARAANGIVQPDLLALEAVAKKARDDYDLAMGSKAELTGILQQTKRAIEDLNKCRVEMEELNKRYATVGYIAEVANGDNKDKITFQRFVLGALLDDVLIASSERLRIMSKGRYLLQRAQQRVDLRKAGGLDLEVYDTYTGTTRSVTTLSGGECFLASLCLALGLADVVQSYAGGIHLETMFVDEGFGTLDPESLDLALRALIDLQEGGRLVGIISHVPELKERIDARLEVIPGRQGSTARFLVG